MSHITNIQRNFVLNLVIICGLLGYPTVAVLTAFDVNPRDPLYYETEYHSTYKFTESGNLKYSGDFSSEVLGGNLGNATLDDDQNYINSSLVTIDGKWINTTAGNTETPYSLPFWFFIENPVQETLSGEAGAHSPKNVYLIDPWGIFGPINRTYTLKYIKFYIEPFPKFANQVSNLYDVYINETDTKIGQALYDTTCGLMWWFDVYNTETDQNIRAELQDTTFVISRNRFFFMYAMLIWFGIGLLFYAFMVYWKKWDKKQIIEMLILVGLGFGAFFIDGILDIWFTNLMPMIFTVHAVFIALMLLLRIKDRNWRVAIIPGLEFLFVAIMLFFHGKIDLVFTFCPLAIAGWMALMADVRGRMRGAQIKPIDLESLKNWFKRGE